MRELPYPLPAFEAVREVLRGRDQSDRFTINEVAILRRGPSASPR